MLLSTCDIHLHIHIVTSCNLLILLSARAVDILLLMYSLWCKCSYHKLYIVEFVSCLYIIIHVSFSLEPQWLKEETLWLDKELVRWASGESSSPHESFRHTYPCKICGKVFKTCSSLSKHKDVHRGTTRCHVCNTVLSRASYLKQHMASVHGLPPHW